jgi:hypothetical protein
MLVGVKSAPLRDTSRGRVCVCTPTGVRQKHKELLAHVSAVGGRLPKRHTALACARMLFPKIEMRVPPSTEEMSGAMEVMLGDPAASAR